MTTVKTIVETLRGLMTSMRPLNLISLMGPIGLIGMLGLMGCSDDSSEDTAQPIAVEVTGYVAGFEDLQGAQGARTSKAFETEVLGFTRAWSAPSGFSLYGEDKTIGICFTKNNKEPKIGQFFKSSGKWRTNIELSPEEVANPEVDPFYLYGYVPHTTAIKCSITDQEGNDAKYNEGAVLTLGNVPTVMPNDLCVVIGAKDGTDKETVTGLSKGDFLYKASAIQKEGANSSNNFVFLLFDHLYAALRLGMKVDGDYAALRTIRLKSLLLSTKVDDTTSKQHTQIAVTLQATDDTDPIANIDYNFDPSDKDIAEDGMEFWSSTAGENLENGNYKYFIGHFMPQDITTLILTSVYDVYDTKGNLIRKDCKATNTMVLSELLTGQTTTRRGCRYTVKMLIKPTYLYVLSDPDLDSPTVEIE